MEENTLSRDILLLLEKGLFSDVELLVDQGKAVFRAHRCILVARCPYFRSILGETDSMRSHHEMDSFGRQQQQQQPIKIMIDTTDVNCFAAVLRFIYSDKAELGAANVWNVLQLATLYQIAGLVRSCEKIIAQGLVPASVLECWTASLKLNPNIDTNFISAQCELYAARNLAQVSYMDSFLTLPTFLFLRLLRTADPQLPSMDQTIVHALLRFLKGPEGEKPGVRAELAQNVPSIMKRMVISYTAPEIIQEMSHYADVFSHEFIGRASNCIPIPMQQQQGSSNSTSASTTMSRLYARRSSDSQAQIRMHQIRDPSHPNMKEVIFSSQPIASDTSSTASGGASSTASGGGGKEWEKYAGKMRFKVSKTGGSAKKAAKHSENQTPSGSASSSRRSSVDVSSFMSFASLTPDLTALARRNSLDPSLLAHGHHPHHSHSHSHHGHHGIDPSLLASALARASSSPHILLGGGGDTSTTRSTNNNNHEDSDSDQDGENGEGCAQGGDSPSLQQHQPPEDCNSKYFSNFQHQQRPTSLQIQSFFGGGGMGGMGGALALDPSPPPMPQQGFQFPPPISTASSSQQSSQHHTPSQGMGSLYLGSPKNQQHQQQHMGTTTTTSGTGSSYMHMAQQTSPTTFASLSSFSFGGGSGESKDSPKHQQRSTPQQPTVTVGTGGTNTDFMSLTLEQHAQQPFVFPPPPPANGGGSGQQDDDGLDYEDIMMRLHQDGSVLDLLADSPTNSDPQ